MVVLGDKFHQQENSISSVHDQPLVSYDGGFYYFLRRKSKGLRLHLEGVKLNVYQNVHDREEIEFGTMGRWKLT